MDPLSLSSLPQHIAIVMDGNGRWANNRHLPRVAGHRAGLEAARSVIQACSARGIQYLSLFAFSSENWKRPEQEVEFLMELFLYALRREIKMLHENNIRFQVIGDRSAFSTSLQTVIQEAEQLTEKNTGMTLLIAANYGGRWDVLQAVQRIARNVLDQTLLPESISAEYLNMCLSTANYPDPDLFIRTSGEMRISNYFLWQMAYAELYFTNILWPDFNEIALDEALTDYAQRQRRYGTVEES